MNDCIFCRIVSATAPARIVYEDALALAFLTIDPLAPGHTLVVPKKHCSSMLDADSDSLSSAIAAAQQVGLKLTDVLGATGFNVLNANGTSAQQSVNPLHFHVVPRFDQDGLDLWPVGKSRIEISRVLIDTVLMG